MLDDAFYIGNKYSWIQMYVLGIDWILKSGGPDKNGSVYLSGHGTVCIQEELGW